MRFVISVLAAILGALITVVLVPDRHPDVMFAVPHSVYGLPTCPTEDHGLPGGCVWQGEEDTWIIYTPPRS